MSIVATMRASLQTTGATGGPVTVVIPPFVASTAVNVNVTVNLPAGFTTLASSSAEQSILGGLVTSASLSGLWLVFPSGSTSSSVRWGVAATMVTITQAPTPAFLGAGFSVAGIGISLSAATTVQLIGF